MQQYVQKLQTGKSEDFRWKHSQSVSVEFQHQQSAGDIVEAARLQDADLVITQIPGKLKYKIKQNLWNPPLL